MIKNFEERPLLYNKHNARGDKHFSGYG